MNSVPFRIIGKINGEIVILRTYPCHVTISIGSELMQFPSYDSAMLYLQKITKQSRYRERTNHVDHRTSTKPISKRKR